MNGSLLNQTSPALAEILEESRGVWVAGSKDRNIQHLGSKRWHRGTWLISWMTADMLRRGHRTVKAWRRLADLVDSSRKDLGMETSPRSCGSSPHRRRTTAPSEEVAAISSGKVQAPTVGNGFRQIRWQNRGKQGNRMGLGLWPNLERLLEISNFPIEMCLCSSKVKSELCRIW